LSAASEDRATAALLLRRSTVRDLTWKAWFANAILARKGLGLMDRADISFWLSIIGTSTAFALALIKGYELFSADRIRLSVTVMLTGSEDVGNTIVILNRSSIPANIRYFDLAWVERRCLLGLPVPFTRKVTKDDSPT
jgi:hypothetical protein